MRTLNKLLYYPWILRSAIIAYKQIIPEIGKGITHTGWRGHRTAWHLAWASAFLCVPDPWWHEEEEQ